MKSDILKCMILQLQDGGNNEKIAALSMQLAKVNNQLNKSLQSNNIQQVQDHIDRESVYQKLKGKLLHLLIIEVVVLCLIVALLLWRRKRSREKTARLIDEELQFQTQLQSMTSMDQSEESEMDKRQKGLQALKERHDKLFNAGKELYEQWRDGASVKDWKKDDFVSLIDYYMSIDIDFVRSLNNDYEGLTPSEMFFLILEHEGESQETITATFDISPTAYRLKKSRIKKKAKA
jgi:ribosomal protein S8E